MQMTLSEITKLVHDLFEQSWRTRNLMPYDDIAKLQKTCVVTGIWPYGTVRQLCITMKGHFKDLVIPIPHAQHYRGMRITNKTLLFGINDNIKSIWQKFINEGIIPELEQQGVEVINN